MAKGQITIIAVIVLFVTLLVLAIMAPLYNTAVSLILNATSDDPTSSLIARSIFPVLLISVILSILGYAAFARRSAEGYGGY